MWRQWIVCHRKNAFYLGVVAVFCFMLGWYMQVGWEPVKTSEVALVIRQPETLPVISSTTEDKERALISFKLNRDREQSRQRERMQELLISAEPGSEWGKKMETELLAMERRINAEHELENLLAARGYLDTAVYLNEGAVTVVFGNIALTPEQVSLVGQWAADTTGYPISQIRIVDQ
jgi:hypothetical protein